MSKRQCSRRRIRVIMVPSLSYGLTNQLYELMTAIAWAAATGAEVRLLSALRWVAHARPKILLVGTSQRHCCSDPDPNPTSAPTLAQSGRCSTVC